MFTPKSIRKLIGFIGVVGMFGMAGPALAAVDGTSHDLAGGDSDQICIYCHTPHDSSAGFVPLWNRETTSTVFTMYATGTVDLMNIDTAPGAVSMACLSCHDGTIAIQDFGGLTSADTTKMAADFVVPANLTTQHPIAVEYDATVDGGNSYNAITLPLYDNAGTDQLECATCHDPHDDTYGSFLRVDNTDSGLCTTCHIK